MRQGTLIIFEAASSMKLEEKINAWREAQDAPEQKLPLDIVGFTYSQTHNGHGMVYSLGCMIARRDS